MCGLANKKTSEKEVDQVIMVAFGHEGVAE
jgi:hypothetical protein